MRLIVGITKKIGQPGFGSVGATCQVESSEFTGDPSSDGFVRRVELAFDACREAVEAELRKHQASPRERNGSVANGRDRSNESTATDGLASKERLATPKQVNALHAMASKSRLSHEQLERVFHGKPIHALTVAEASAAIDRLKVGPAASGSNRPTQPNL